MTKRIGILLAICLLLLGAGQASAQQVRNGSTAFTAGGMGGIYNDRCGDDNVCNATNFGTPGIGKDWSMIEKAYQTAFANHQPLYIPAGTYHPTYPLVFSGTGSLGNFNPVKVYGAGGFNPVAALTALTFSGAEEGIMSVPPDYVTSLGTIQTPAFVGASGNAAQWNNGKPWFLRLNGMGLNGYNANSLAPLNGKSAITVRFYFKTPQNSGIYYITDSGTGGGAINIEFQVGAALAATLDIAGSLHTISGGTVSKDTAYFGALVLCASGCADAGANMYLYLCTPNQAGCSPVAKTGVSGTITQSAAETWAIGMSLTYPPTGVHNPSQDFVGQLQSFDIENTNLYTGAAITAPNANFTANSPTTMYLNNFLQVGGSVTENGVTVNNVPFAEVDHPFQSGAGYQAIYNPTYDGNARGTEIADLGVSGGVTALFVAMEPLSSIHNLVLSNYKGIGLEMYNNSYNSTLRDIYGLGFPSAQAGLECSWFVGTVQNMQFGGGAYPISGLCGTDIHPIITTTADAAASILVTSSYSAFNSNIIIDPEVDNEVGSAAPAIEDAACGSGPLVINGGGLIGGASAIQVDNPDSGCPDLTVNGTSLWGTNAVNFTKTSPTTPPYAVLTNAKNNATHLSNKPQWISEPGCGGTKVLSTGTGTLSNVCLTTASICTGFDITTPANAVTLAAPAEGSVAITGTGSDEVRVGCQ